MMRTLLVISVSLFLVVASLQADAKHYSGPFLTPSPKHQLKGTTTISGRRLLTDDGDNEKNKAHGNTASPSTVDQTHHNVVDAHNNP